MRKLKPYNEVNFKNSLNQVIRPQDKVAIVTTAWKRTRIGAGRYVGCRGAGRNLSVVVVYDRVKQVYRDKKTGEAFKENEYLKANPYPTYPIHRYGDLNYNSTVAYTKYNEEFKDWLDKKAAHLKAKFKLVEEPYEKYSTLQLNRIFKIDTLVVDISEEI